LAVAQGGGALVSGDLKVAYGFTARTGLGIAWADLSGVDGLTTPLVLAIRAMLRTAVRDKLTLARRRTDYKLNWRGAIQYFSL
jgi:hypothetical protein